MDASELPLKPCHMCKKYAWYWADHFQWNKQWVCGICHPKPDTLEDTKHENTKNKS